MPGPIALLITAPWGERLGGAEAMLWSILRHLDGDRVAPAVVFLQEGPFERDVASLGIPTSVVPCGRLRNPLSTAGTVRRLARLFRERQPDLILNWSPKMQLYGGPAARLAGMSERVVWWQHGVPNGHWMDRLATALPTRAIGCSSNASLAAQRKLTPRRPGFVVHPGVEPGSRLNGAEAAALRRELGIAPERAVVGILGRLQPWKGQHRLIRAVHELRRRGHDVHGLIVGGDAYGLSPEYERGLRQLVSQLGLEERVSMTGQVTEPHRYVSLMDVLVNASDDEPFGIVLLEAMALGVSVVAPASAGPLEIIEPDRSGVLVDSPEPGALAAGIGRLLADPDWREELAAQGRERCLAEFSAAQTAERLVSSLGAIAGAAPEPGHVVLVAHDIQPVGGMERQLSELIDGLLRRGWRITVVSRTLHLEERPGLRWLRVRAPGRPFPLAYPWFFLAAALKVRQADPGLLHTTGAIVLGRPDLATVHLCHAAIRERSSVTRASRATLSYRVNAALAGWMSRVTERWCYRRTRLLAGVSGGVSRELEEFLPDTSGRVRTVQNGVDSERFRPARSAAERSHPAVGAPDGRLVALFVAGEWEGKGLRLAIEAVARSPEWRLVVVGRGDVARYRELARRAGVGDRVRFAGPVVDIAPVYRAADAFVLPTSYETFSLVTYEAAASGLPLLVPRVSGVEDLLEDGVSGWFVPLDVGAIADRLDALGRDPSLRERFGRAAREASLRFTWNRMVESYLELYRELSPRQFTASEPVLIEDVRSSSLQPHS